MDKGIVKEHSRDHKGNAAVIEPKRKFRDEFFVLTVMGHTFFVPTVQKELDVHSWVIHCADPAVVSTVVCQRVRNPLTLPQRDPNSLRNP